MPLRFSGKQEIDHFFWGENEPNDINNAEDYISLSFNMDYKWNDENGDTKENHLTISKFICQFCKCCSLHLQNG